MKKFGFSRSSRMTRETDFRRAFEGGSKTVAHDMVMWCGERVQRGQSPNGGSPASRIGIVVSRKHGNSCRRNRLKRLIREAFRLNNRKLCKGIDMVICPRMGCTWGDLDSVEKALFRIWKKAGIYDRSVCSQTQGNG